MFARMMPAVRRRVLGSEAVNSRRVEDLGG
jgi:hypothetical protein